MSIYLQLSGKFAKSLRGESVDFNTIDVLGAMVGVSCFQYLRFALLYTKAKMNVKRQEGANTFSNCLELTFYSQAKSEHFATTSLLVVVTLLYAVLHMAGCLR